MLYAALWFEGNMRNIVPYMALGGCRPPTRYRDGYTEVGNSVEDGANLAYGEDLYAIQTVPKFVT